MAYPPKLTEAAFARIEEVCLQRDAIPSDKELARELGVSRWTISKRMAAYRKGQRFTVSRQAPVDLDALADEAMAAVAKEPT